MMHRKSRFAVALLCATVCSAPAVLAKNTARLEDAQKAYANVDYENTRALASAAIKQGGNDQAATGELYLLWATAAAALDQADEARNAFVYALATNPELKLEHSLSPKIRAPYLEARGALPGADGKAPLDIVLQRRKQELEVVLRDKLNVAAHVELATRADEGAPFARRRLEPAPTKRVPVPNGSELQLFVTVLDRYDNILFQLGSEDEPRRLALVSSGSAPIATPKESSNVNRVPYYVTAGALAALGAASGGVATAMYLRRQDAARDWNGPGCEHPGMTRAEQCNAVDDRRQRDEYLSISFAATGGAFLLGSFVSLLLAPSAPAHTSVALDAGPREAMLRLRTTL